MKLSTEQEEFKNAVLNGKESNILLGKAGVGKSVCIRAVISEAAEQKKKFFVLAPTGIAALNVRGETIHRFLVRLRTELYLRGRQAPDFILIDECSMVRADLLDKLDKALRLSTGATSKPFGGVPITLIGDCAQLPPVVTSADKLAIESKYKSPWFFSAACFSEVDWRFHELTQVFRQTDPEFVTLLNKMRIGDVADSVEYLNLNRTTELARGTILVATNNAAKEINAKQLDRIGGATHFYDAQVWGEFEEREYPTEERLGLCVGARVMCVKNIYDCGELVLVNGDTGKIENCGASSVTFSCDRTQQCRTITIEDGTWQKVERTPSATGNVETVIGGFSQIPLRLAWAITVHKAQGATLHEVTIDMRSRFFAEGQAYVALSRGSAMERLWLLGKMLRKDVILSSEAQNFMALRMASPYIHQKKQQEFFKDDN